MSYTPERIAELNNLRLAKVNVRLAEKCHEIIKLAKDEGYSLVVTQGFRSASEQHLLYLIGRRGRKGERKVTNADSGHSNHEKDSAVDFAFVVNGEIVWTENLYLKIGVWAKQVGLKWGGDWKSIKDKPHVEL